MKVLHVINSLQAGGAERLLADLLPALGRTGVECEVLALDGRGDVFSRSLESEGIPVKFIRKEGGSPYSPFRLPAILRAIRTSRPEFVHVHLAPSLYWVAVAAFFLRSCGYLVTEHASRHRRMGMPILRVVERILYSRYDRIVCVSEDTRDSIKNWLGFEYSRFQVISNGIPMDRFAARAIHAGDIAEWVGDRRAIAMTARLVVAKDHKTALRALALLPAAFVLVFVGGGAERSALMGLRHELGLDDRCLFAGIRTDIPEVLAACEFYLQSSSNEGFGIAALEAMAVGLPVVASEVEGLGKLVRGAGLLFPPGDAPACAAAIESLAANPELTSGLVRAGRERAAVHGIAATASAYKGLYGRLLDGKQPLQ